MDDIKKWQEEFLAYVSGLNLPRDDFKGIVGYIEEVPAVKPEQLTDKEQRIFLTAMAREEKSRYYVEGYFEGCIEADSADEAEGNFDESDIEDITILTVYKDEEDEEEDQDE